MKQSQAASMIWQYVYLAASFAAVAMLGVLIVYAWRRRNRRGAAAFAGMMLAGVEWLLASLLIMLSRTQSAATWWQTAAFFGIACAPVTLLIFALQYTGRDKWLTPGRAALLFVVPLITQVMAWTNDAHGLFLQHQDFAQEGILMYRRGSYQGLWFGVHAAYSYLILLLALVLLALYAVRSFQFYRLQSVALLLGILPPVITNVITTFRLIPDLRLNISPLGFALMGPAFAWAVFRRRMLDVVPVARDALIDGMSDGMLVLDAENRIVDFNPAMQTITGLPLAQAIGQPAAQALSPWRDLVERLRTETHAQTEIMLERQGGPAFYDLGISTLTDRAGQVTGRLIVLLDITARKRAEQIAQQALQREMNLAHNIQTSLLPPAAPHIPGLEVAGQSLPARQVGGDFYAYYTLPPTGTNQRGGYALAVGDVSGKGIPSALYMAVSTTMLAAKAPFVPDAAQLLDNMNAALYPNVSPNQMNVALCYVRFEPDAEHGYTVHIANAGLISPLLRRGERCDYLDIGGLPLGMLPDAPPYRAIQLTLQAGNMLVLCSDGIVEAMNAASELYGLDRLAARIASGPAAAQEMIDWIMEDMRAFAGGIEQHDDATIVAVRVSD